MADFQSNSQKLKLCAGKGARPKSYSILKFVFNFCNKEKFTEYERLG